MSQPSQLTTQIKSRIHNNKHMTRTHKKTAAVWGLQSTFLLVCHVIKYSDFGV